jgi:hypothetical protein
MTSTTAQVSTAKIKLAIAKLIEISYATDSNLTVSLLSQRGPAKLTVDQRGNASFSGSAGRVTFEGSPALEAIGAQVKSVSVSFTNQGGMRIGYTAIVGVKVIDVMVAGSFDLEQMMTSCSGLLCRAARALRGRSAALELEQQRIMGY